MKILVVEDEPLMADFLRRGLQAEGHAVTTVIDGHEGQAYGMDHEFDLILMDVTLPGISGLKVCEALRGAGIATPIMMLTARDSIADKVDGLRHGADDYLVKPYAFDELVARIDALMRRHNRSMLPSSSANPLMMHGDICFDREYMRVTRAGQPLALTAKEVGILELLLARPGAVISRERILNSVWGVHADPLTNIVEVYMGRLRRKLNVLGPPVIETVRSFGYRLIE
jgi:DNA-binding response OmpR family regulator